MFLTSINTLNEKKKVSLMKSKRFSLIEMLTVIIVILVLITLMIPSLNRLRAKARSVICANQLKQIGTLVSTYANDHDGRLPYSGKFNYNVARDIKNGRLLGSMYAGWSGHLLPYFDLDVSTYSRFRVYYEEAIDDVTAPNQVNHQIIKDQLFNGGYGPLSLLVCPDAANTIDARSLVGGNSHPRVSAAVAGSWTWRYTGLPTSYLGHGEMFGNVSPYSGTKPNSMRMEDVNKRNMMMAEGSNYRHIYGPNMTFYANMGNNAYSFAGTFNMTGYYDGSNKIHSDTVLFSYLHDDTKELWVSSFSRGVNSSFVNKFNKAYFPYAAASKDYDAPEHNKGALASTLYPNEDWSRYKEVLGTRAFTISRFYSEDVGKNYFFGSMNILGADLSVSKRHIGWIYENARDLALGNR